MAAGVARVMPVPASLEAICVCKSLTAAATVLSLDCRVMSTGALRPAPVKRMVMLAGFVIALASVTFSPPVTVEVIAAASALLVASTNLPISAFDTRSPAST